MATNQYKHLEIKRLEKMVVITLNRPKALNALNIDLINELGEFFDSGYAAVDGHFSAVVITGEGPRAFAAGADISEFQGLNASEGKAFAKRGQTVFRAIEEFHVPVIAAVNGFALGGGCELAMACHLRIASDNARFGQPEVNLGLIPGYGGTQRLPVLIGKGRAMELILTGKMIGAEKAMEYGLVNAVVPEDELMKAVSSMVEELASKGPIALEKAIEAVNALHNVDVNGYDIEADVFGGLLATNDFREGTAAFLEKRKANFTGS